MWCCQLKDSIPLICAHKVWQQHPLQQKHLDSPCMTVSTIWNVEMMISDLLLFNFSEKKNLQYVFVDKTIVLRQHTWKELLYWTRIIVCLFVDPCRPPLTTKQPYYVLTYMCVCFVECMSGHMLSLLRYSWKFCIVFGG